MSPRRRRTRKRAHAFVVDDLTLCQHMDLDVSYRLRHGPRFEGIAYYVRRAHVYRPGRPVEDAPLAVNPDGSARWWVIASRPECWEGGWPERRAAFGALWRALAAEGRGLGCRYGFPQAVFDYWLGADCEEGSCLVLSRFRDHDPCGRCPVRVGEGRGFGEGYHPIYADRVPEGSPPLDRPGVDLAPYLSEARQEADDG